MAPLGFAVPFFFRYAKICIQALLIIFFVNSVYRIVTESSDNSCGYGDLKQSEPRCGQAWKFFISRGNEIQIEHEDWTESGLFIASFVVLVLMRIFYQYKFLALDNKLDNDNIDITDYTVLAYNLPQNCKEPTLERFFKTNFKDPETNRDLDIKVASINFIYQNFNKVIKKGNDLEKQLEQHRKKFDSSDQIQIEEMKENFISEVDKVGSYIYKLYDQKDMNSGAKRNFTGIAMVTLESAQDVRVIKKHYLLTGLWKTVYNLLGYIPKPILKCVPNNSKHDFRSGSYIFLDNPIPPEDIIWANMGRGKFNNITRRLISFLGTILILSSTLVILLGLKVCTYKFQI